MWLPVCEIRSQPRFAPAVLRSRVLIVDDDEDFRNLARQILEPAGFLVTEAEDVAQCLSRLRSDPVDAIVLDVVMPGRGGIEGLPDLKAMSPGTKILMVSGAVDFEVSLAASAGLGADASLGKSKIAVLGALLNVLLEERS
jgi:DNA-binding NtrC family response regulator